MTWHTGRLACFDFETTGTDPHRDRVVTAAIIEVGGGQPSRTSEWLVNPGITIPEGATVVHGITTEHAETHGVDAAGAIYEIAEHLLRLAAAGVPIVGHNVTYDLTMLWAECVRQNISFGPNHSAAVDVAKIAPVIDTMVLDKWVDPYRPKAPTARRKDPAKCGSRKLIDTARVWGITLTEAEAHGAAADALAAGRLAWSLAQNTPGLQISAAEVHALQVTEKRTQADSFGAYLAKQGKPDDVARSWPIQELPDGWTPEQLPIVREDVAS